MVNYGLNKIELNFDAQYKVVTLTVYFITYLLYRALALALLWKCWSRTYLQNFHIALVNRPNCHIIQFKNGQSRKLDLSLLSVSFVNTVQLCFSDVPMLKIIGCAINLVVATKQYLTF